MIEAQSKKLILAVDGSPHSNAAIELVAGLDLPASAAWRRSSCALRPAQCLSRDKLW
jgi:hypothetical protein